MDGVFRLCQGRDRGAIEDPLGQLPGQLVGDREQAVVELLLTHERAEPESEDLAEEGFSLVARRAVELPALGERCV